MSGSHPQRTRKRKKSIPVSDSVQEQDDDRITDKRTKKRQIGAAASNISFVDLSDIPYQQPILKNEFTRFYDNSRKRPIKPNASKYTGVYFSEMHHSWRAQIQIKGRVTIIGNYENEEQAAVDYARAAYKYKPKTKTIFGGYNLSDIQEQPLIFSETSKSGYKGVKEHSANKNRWEARISIKGVSKTLGTFDTVQEAASIYAKADYYIEHEKELVKEHEKTRRSGETTKPANKNAKINLYEV